MDRSKIRLDRARAEVIPFLGFDPAIRKSIYTTNAIESLNRVIGKSIKTRGSFPTDEAATKLICLAIRNFEKDGRNVREWFAARNLPRDPGDAETLVLQIPDQEDLPQSLHLPAPVALRSEHQACVPRQSQFRIDEVRNWY